MGYPVRLPAAAATSAVFGLIVPARPPPAAVCLAGPARLVCLAVPARRLVQPGLGPQRRVAER
jgi:hypothetical protein